MTSQTVEVRVSTVELLHKLYGHTGEKVVDIMERLVQSEWNKVTEEEEFKRQSRALGQTIMARNNANNSWMTGDEFKAKLEEKLGADIVAQMLSEPSGD